MNGFRHRWCAGYRIALGTLVFLGLSIGPAFAADITAPFAGKTVNGGTVTHEARGGKHILQVSADFQVPGSPIRTGRWSIAKVPSICSIG